MILTGDCLALLPAIRSASVDAIVTDPPYGLGFMGKNWDHGVPGEPFWREALRVAKPGAHLLAFSGTRTWHRLACAIEDAGWEIRDTIATLGGSAGALLWVHGQGFPKSRNVTDELKRSLPAGAQCVCVHGLRQTAPSSLVDCPSSRGSDDALLRRDLEGAPGVALTLGGALARTRDDQLAGDLAGARANTFPGGANGLRASGDSPDQPAPLSAGSRSSGSTQSGTGASTSPASPRESRRTEPRTPSTSGSDGGLAASWTMESLRVSYPNIPLCQECGKFAVPTGLGTALKPAFEPIILARKPLVGTVAANVTAHGAGALNIDGCRIGIDEAERGAIDSRSGAGRDATADIYAPGLGRDEGQRFTSHTAGRWPANVVLDEDAAALLDAQSGERPASYRRARTTDPHGGVYGEYGRTDQRPFGHHDSGGASRFFFVAQEGTGPTQGSLECSPGAAVNHGADDNLSDGLRFVYTAKASRSEREAGLDGGERKAKNWSSGDQNPGSFQAKGTDRTSTNHHPTVKPLDLMRWLCRLVTPTGGLILDPFAGSGTTGCAAALEGFRFLGMEREPEYAEIARRRIAYWESLHQPSLDLGGAA